jgi:cyanophycinase
VSDLVLGLMGSGEFEPWAAEVDRWLLEHARRGSGRVLVLPTASAPEGDEVFDGWAERGLAHYESIGASARVLGLKTREDAARPGCVAALEDASMVFLSGGNPAYLAATLRATPFWEALLVAMEGGMAYGGCSAGAACLAEVVPDSSVVGFSDRLWQPGLGLFRDARIGPHWDALDSFVSGLTDHIVRGVPPGTRLVGIDEATAMLGDGNGWTVTGRGSVHVYLDGKWEHHGPGERLTVALTRASEPA